LRFGDRLLSLLRRSPTASYIVDLKTKAGMKMKLNISDFVDQHLFVYGTYEPGIESLLRKYLRNGDSFVDVGANIGYFSLFASRIVGSGGVVHAFEPATDTYSRLVKNMAINSFENTRSYKNALGDECVKSELKLSTSENTGKTSLRPLTTSRGHESVECLRLDSFNEMIDVPPKVVKIDVEGFELRVIKGMSGIFERNPMKLPIIIFEFSPEYLIENGDQPEDLLTILRNQGYDLKVIDWDGSLRFFDSQEINGSSQVNVCALPAKQANASSTV
jgi:FkbM family methyltransferase